MDSSSSSDQVISLIGTDWKDAIANRSLPQAFELSPETPNVAPRDSFGVDDIRTTCLQHCDIPELKLMSQMNGHWKELSENENLWKKIGISLGSTLLLSKDQVKKYYQTTQTQAHNCFDNTELSEGFRQELNRLYNSERVEDIHKLAEVCKARDVLVVWKKLQIAIGGNVDLNLFNFDTIDALIAQAEQFPKWCELNQNALSLVQTLDLSSNQLTSLPVEIGKLTGLKELYLNSNQLSALTAEIGNLTALVKLNLCNNKLTALPAKIGNLSALVWLYLSNNQMTTLPAEIGNLAVLVRLDLKNNQLTALPAEIGKLARLRGLDLANNHLTTLPKEIGKLVGLKTLYLNNNLAPLQQAEIGNLPRLIWLSR